jgi:hypothetical protein
MNSKIMPVTIRLTWKEKDQLLKAAKAINVNMSDYIRKHVPELKGNK